MDKLGKLGIKVSTVFDISAKDITKKLALIEKQIGLNVKLNLDGGIAAELVKQTEKFKDNSNTAYERIKQYNDGLGTTVKIHEQINTITNKVESSMKTVTTDTTKAMDLVHKEALRMNKDYDKLVNSMEEALQKTIARRKEDERIWNLRQDQAINKNLETQYKVTSELKKQKGLMSDIKHNAKKFLEYYTIGNVVIATQRVLQDIVDSVIELDDAQVELAKVTNLTNIEIDRLTEQAFELSFELGKTTSEVLESISAFSKMGYQANSTAKDLGYLALMLTNIGDGISLDQATSSITAALKGFEMGSQDAQKIVDSYNEISNNFAVTTLDLVEAVEKVSATMNQAGNTFDETLSLFTASNEIINNASRSATAMRTIALRIRGVDELGNSLNDLVPSLEKNFNKFNLTLLDTDGSFKSTYDILKDLSTVYKDMSDMDFANISELISGKRSSDVLNAILQNFTTATASLESSLNSLGSAAAENERFMDSISGSIARFDSALQSLSTNTLDSETVKLIVDLGTGFIGLVDKAGMLNVAIATLTTTLFLMKKTVEGKGEQRLISIYFSNIAKAVKGVGTSAKASKLAVEGLKGVLTFGASLLIGFGIEAVIKFFTNATHAMERQKEEVDNLRTGLKDLNSELDNLYDKRDKTKADYIRIDLLEKELEIQKELLKIEQWKLMNKELFGKGWGDGVKQEVDDIEKTLIGYQTNMQDYLINGSKMTQEGIDNTVETLLKLEEQLVSSKKKLEEYKAIYGEDLPKDAKILEKSIEGLTLQFSNTYDILAKLAGIPEENIKRWAEEKSVIVEDTEATKDNAGAKDGLLVTQQDLDAQFKSSNESISKFTSSSSNLADVYESLANNEDLTIDKINELIALYPDYSSEIININENKEESLSITEELFNLKKEEAIQDQIILRDKLKQQRAQLAGEIEILKIEAERAKLKSTLSKPISLLGDNNDNPYPVTNKKYTFGTQEMTSESEKAINEANKAIKNAEARIKHLQDLNLTDFNRNNNRDELDDKNDSLDIIKTDLEVIQDLYSNNLISIKEYIQRLTELRDNHAFADLGKSAEELAKNEAKISELLKDPKKVDSLENYLDLVGLISDANKEIVDSIEQQQDEYKQLSDDIRGMVVDALKEQQEVQEENLKNAKDSIEEEIKLVEEAEKEKVNIRYDALKESYQRQKDLLQKQYDESKHEEDVQSKKDEIKGLQDRLALTSNEKERYDLNKQISDLQKQLIDEETQYELKKEQEKLDKQIDLLDERKDAELNDIEEQKDRTIEATKVKIMWEGKYTTVTVREARNRLNTVNSALTDMETKHISYVNRAEGIMKGSSDSILDFLKDNLSELSEYTAQMMTELENQLDTFEVTRNNNYKSTSSGSASSYSVSKDTWNNSTTSQQSAHNTAQNAREELISKGLGGLVNDISSITTAEGREALYNNSIKDSSLDSDAKKLFKDIVDASYQWSGETHHTGGFGGGTAFDPRHEVFAKILKGEGVFTGDMMTRGYENLVKPLASISKMNFTPQSRTTGNVKVDVHIKNADFTSQKGMKNATDTFGKKIASLTQSLGIGTHNVGNSLR